MPPSALELMAWRDCDGRCVPLRPSDFTRPLAAGPYPDHDIGMRSFRLLALFVALFLVACNDLTAPLPSIAGTYQYSAVNSAIPAHNRQGVIRIEDEDRRTARFDGTYSYSLADGSVVSGRLTGAFVAPTRIWFR